MRFLGIERVKRKEFVLISRRKRKRYLEEAARIADTTGRTIDLEDWDAIWDLLDEIRNIRSKSFVYFIADDYAHAVKIGRSSSPAWRLHQLQTANPHPLRMLGYFEESDTLSEAILHERFSDHHVRGEWFRYTQVLRDFLIGLVKAREALKQQHRHELSSPKGLK